MSTGSSRQVTVDLEDVDENGVHSSAKCGCGALWFNDAEGTTLDSWTDTHVCFDEVLLGRIRGLANSAKDIRLELLPTVQAKIHRFSRTSVLLACACLRGDPQALHDLAAFEEWLGHVREELEHLDVYLQLEPPPELRLVPSPDDPAPR